MIVLYRHPGEQPSHRLLVQAVAHHTGLPEEDPRLTVVRSRDQRPAFPYLIEQFYSVSHSRGLWMCAVGDVPLGLDLQVHQDCDRARLSARFFHPEEDSWLNSRGCTPEDFFQIWVRKEAYVKYLGLGIAQGLDWFSVVKNGRLRERLEQVCFLSPPAPVGFSLSLCTEKPDQMTFHTL